VPDPFVTDGSGRYHVSPTVKRHPQHLVNSGFLRVGFISLTPVRRFRGWAPRGRAVRRDAWRAFGGASHLEFIRPWPLSGDFWPSGRDVWQLPAKMIAVGLGSTPPAPPTGSRAGALVNRASPPGSAPRWPVPLSPTETSCRWARRRSLPTQPPSWSVFPMGGT